MPPLEFERDVPGAPKLRMTSSSEKLGGSSSAGISAKRGIRGAGSDPMIGARGLEGSDWEYMAPPEDR